MGAYAADEWLEVAQGRRAATWKLWARPIEASNCLTDAGKETASWAAEQLSHFLGDQWLGKALGGPVSSWIWAPWNDVPHTFRRLIELGARIATTVEVGQGWRRLKNLARKSPDWSHVLLQLEVGALAIRDGWQAELEPPLPSGNRADLRLAQDQQMFLVETTTMGFGENWQAEGRFSDNALDALMIIGLRNDVVVAGELRSAIPEDELRAWLKDVAVTAARIRGSSLAAVIDFPGGGQIELSRRSTHPQPRGLSGPRQVEDVTARLARTLKNKALQGASEEPLWVRINEDGGLWHLTVRSQWPQRRDMHEALAKVVLSVVDQTPHLAGVVLSETPMMGTGGHCDLWTLCEGRALGLRQSLPYGCGREAVMVSGMQSGSPRQLSAWARWYRQEASWLDWALSRHGQPALANLLAPEMAPSQRDGGHDG